jgi:hypothetical protein
MRASSGTLVGVGPTELQIGVCVLISIAAVAALLIVWRDDHKWLERHEDAASVAEPSPYPLGFRKLVRWPTVGHDGRS